MRHMGAKISYQKIPTRKRKHPATENMNLWIRTKLNARKSQMNQKLVGMVSEKHRLEKQSLMVAAKMLRCWKNTLQRIRPQLETSAETFSGCKRSGSGTAAFDRRGGRQATRTAMRVGDRNRRLTSLGLGNPRRYAWENFCF